ncbi:hypothetical protein D3C74_386090 [compost metagenome]
MVNYSMDSEGYPNIVLVDLDKRNKVNITHNSAENTGYYLTTVTADARFIAQKSVISAIDQIVVIEIE